MRHTELLEPRVEQNTTFAGITLHNNQTLEEMASLGNLTSYYITDVFAYLPATIK